MSENNNVWEPAFKGATEDMHEFMNSEIEDTPEVRAIFQRIADEMLLESAKEEVEEYRAPVRGPDVEKELMDNLHLFERYIAISELREPVQAIWEGLRYRRNTWWSAFKEEMDYNWMELDVFDTKLNKRMMVVQPTKEQWEKAMARRSFIYQRCRRRVSERWDITNGLFQKAMAATKACQYFWTTDHGIALTQYNNERSNIWAQIQALNVTFEDYNNLVGMEFNPYWTNGETEEVDTMELMANTLFERLDDMEVASQEEDSLYQMAESTGPAYWDYKAEWKMIRLAEVEQKQGEIESDYQRGLLDSFENSNGYHTSSLFSSNGACFF